MRKFEKLKKELKDYWGFILYDKGEYFKTRYCVRVNLYYNCPRWIGYTSLKEIEKIYFKERLEK